MQLPAYHGVSAVARMLGIAAVTLRAWERRYRAVMPVRLPNGRRTYSDDDLARLRLLKRLVDAGHPIGRVAKLDAATLERAVAELDGAEDPTSLGAVRRAFLRALDRGDFTRCERILARTAALVEPLELARDVVGPLLTSIGERWACGKLTVAQEHAASAQIRAVLGAILRAEQHSRGPRVLVTTLARERHEGGALAAALVAATAGFSVVYLGADVPSVEIARAAARMQTRAVLLSIVRAQRGGADDARSLVRALPPNASLIVGGRAAPRYLRIMGRRAVYATLDSLIDHLRLAHLPNAAVVTVRTTVRR